MIGGGAIYWTGANGKLINCTFTNNAGRGLLYDPYAQAEVIVDEETGMSTIIDWPSMRPNGASTNHGGAIVWKGSNAFISGCVFTGNVVDYPDSGGAIYMTSGNALIESSRFFGNSAWAGIAICYYGAGLIINSSYINETSQYGSGHYAVDGVNYTIINPVEDEIVVIDGSFADLQNKITTAIDTLILDKDYTYYPNDEGNVLINKTITIDGNNHVINATGLSKIFNVTAANVTVKNIVFIYDNYENFKVSAAFDWTGANGNINNCTVLFNRYSETLGAFVELADEIKKADGVLVLNKDYKYFKHITSLSKHISTVINSDGPVVVE